MKAERRRVHLFSLACYERLFPAAAGGEGGGSAGACHCRAPRIVTDIGQVETADLRAAMAGRKREFFLGWRQIVATAPHMV